MLIAQTPITQAINGKLTALLEYFVTKCVLY